MAVDYSSEVRELSVHEQVLAQSSFATPVVSVCNCGPGAREQPALVGGHPRQVERELA